MTDINDFISSIVSEAALDARIPDGVVDLKRIEHVQIVAEAIYNACHDEQVVNEFVSSILNEGKYPERQAFNKDGWLVTFPSKEYRDAAIKKGTHSVSDPTHGKGGMNLYYKRKGKQKRQTQQQTTAVAPQQQAPTKPSAPSAPTTQSPSAPTEPKTGEPSAEPSKAPQAEPKTPTAEPSSEKPTPQAQPTEPTAPSAEAPSAEPSATKPSDAPAIDVPVVTQPPAEYANVSKQFAAKKGWMAEPYGEYRDRDGNSVAVVGLSGEIVPIKSVDRDEYKLFAEKSMV